ncbi:OmpA family protein [Rhodanobacter glycinis]|uniref:OmpA family protein n=1 Tax=Rhodanobacter glycinis TaxID=582702 RepID=A0A502CEJ8_9GAMM|nr:OmpA family protein [Rhodanobacter glycinis]TPG11080.1 OmpA family protein [Rhodanobacter glycinis]
MIAVPRKTLAALVCLALGTPLDHGFAAHAQDAMPACADGDALCHDRLNGRVVNDAAVFRADAPPSSEAERATLAASGLAPSELRRMRADAAQPAPATPSQVSAQLGDDTQANFVSGRAELTDAAKASLAALAAQLDGYDIQHAIVVGHTDSQRISARLKPVYPDNQALSEARAAAVAGYLKQRLGLSADTFAIAGKGPSEPVASNATTEGMARNRRVTIEVWGTRKTIAATVPAPSAQSLCGPADGNITTTLAQPFQLSLDGAPLDGQTPAEADRQRCVDVALASDTLQVRYDPMDVAPALNAWAASGAERDQPVVFRSWSNYAAWVGQAEIRIFERGRSTQDTPLAVLPIPLGGQASWQAPADAPDQLFYVLRVSDAKGRFDETTPKALTLVEHLTTHDDLESAQREALAGYGENTREVANIPVHGGTVTVNGHVDDAATAVSALGEQVPVGRDGKFAMQQILPAGSHAVVVTTRTPDGIEANYRRNIVIPGEDWFYVAMADVTAGHGRASANALVVDPSLKDETKHSFVDGRLAFYTRGQFANGYQLTASADTREQPLSDLFSNFASKDPRYLLRRIDPDQYYPVYGDDSTAIDDAPTQGKFFVKLKKNDSELMWGDFLTAWTGSELVQYSRGLYGANLLWKSQDSTSLGERRSSLNAFAADPGTIASREEFRGTGGSLYYLHQQDVTVGSERLWVEIRDRDSGLVLQRTLLVPGSDYDLSYLQGRILLREPLSSVADGSGLVQTGSLSGNPVYLVANYEFVPGITAIDQLATGARGEHWFNDHFRLGATSYRQAGDGTDQSLGGLDATLRYKPGTFLRAESARSKGDGLGSYSSIDGGFGFQPQAPGSTGGIAWAQRIDGALSLADFIENSRGQINAYWQDRDAGFSAPGQITLGGEATRQAGVRADVPLGERTDVSLKVDRRDAPSQDTRVGEASVRRRLATHWTGSLGMRSENRGIADTTLIRSDILAENGTRTDAIARFEYASEALDTHAPTTKLAAVNAWNGYGFVQQTLVRTGTRSDNDRVGLGGGWQATDRVHLDAEVSDGDGGTGGKLGTDYRINDRSNAYAQYLMETERPDLAYRGRFGTLLGGVRSKLNDRVSVYQESRQTTGSGQDSLVNAFGIDLAASDRWTTGLKLEQGTVSDPLSGDMRRQAAGVSLAYKDDFTKLASSLEYRYEDGNLSGRRTSWLTRNTLGNQLSPAWRLLGKLDMARSSSSQGVFFDGDYTEGVLGAAYRPVDNDRWNTLVKYTYMYDLPSPGQLSPSSGYDQGSGLYASTVADYSQKSQVFSIDTIWDVNPWLSLGAKYGYRWGSLKPTRTAGDWFDSTADLMVLRGEWHFVRKWSGLVEVRRLHAREAGDTKKGILVGVYRQLAKHVKLGVGYNFTDFSDSLTDLSYDHRGVFVNVLSTF